MRFDPEADADLNTKLIPSTQPKPSMPSSSATETKEKFSDFLKNEKLRRYKRMPRVYNQRAPVAMKCPSCGSERNTRTKLESTGSQWCACIMCCWIGGYVLCCLPFCCKQCYNVRHTCPNC